MYLEFEGHGVKYQITHLIFENHAVSSCAHAGLLFKRVDVIFQWLSLSLF